MKKLLGILVLGLLWCNVGFAGLLTNAMAPNKQEQKKLLRSGAIKVGMDLKSFKKAFGCSAYACTTFKLYKNSNHAWLQPFFKIQGEQTFIFDNYLYGFERDQDAKKFRAKDFKLVHIWGDRVEALDYYLNLIPAHYVKDRKHYLKKRQQALNYKIYATRKGLPVGISIEDEFDEAVAIANPDYAKRIEDEKKAEEAEIAATKKAQKEAYEAYEKQKKEKEKKKAEEEKKKAEEKRIAEEKAREAEYEKLEAKHKRKCKKGYTNPKGFEIGTPEYKNCILDTEKQIVAKEEEKRIAEEKKIAQEKKLTEIDPDLIPIATGSGFFVSRDGYAITNEHVAGICQLMAIKVGGKKHYLNVVTTDRVNDLGLLKGNYKHPKYLEIDIEGAELGEDIVAMGYPLGEYTGAGVKITKGIVSALSGPGNNYSEFQIDAAIGPGSSGGPIINKSAQVVGVAYGGVNKYKALIEEKHIPENVNFAISSQTLTNFLKANKVQYIKASGNREYDTKTIAKIGDEGTVQLYCLNTREAYAEIKRANKHTDVLLDLK